MRWCYRQLARPTLGFPLLTDPALQPRGDDHGDGQREERQARLGHEADEEARGRTHGSDRDPVPHARQLGK